MFIIIFEHAFVYLFFIHWVMIKIISFKITILKIFKKIVKKGDNLNILSRYIFYKLCKILKYINHICIYFIDWKTIYYSSIKKSKIFWKFLKWYRTLKIRKLLFITLCFYWKSSYRTFFQFNSNFIKVVTENTFSNTND